MFLLYRVLGIVGDLYVILKTVVKGLGFLEKGFIVEWIDPVIRQESFLLVWKWVLRYRSALKRSLKYSTALCFNMGVPVEYDARVVVYKECEWLTVYSVIGFRDELGEKFEELKERLENALEDEDIKSPLNILQLY